ncbi:hypothetical protein [Sphingomonas sp. S-NIH.Pt1_0416]|uniref:hypothetical protein n=1 Tax=Sphingomonas sp. S-NIH.Pt1_0416 TaxID=1920123 RepID=UPI000F7F32BB|nr:hypothetical protein [Sphingomonas sp. S-NIH.Pt1_0416]
MIQERGAFTQRSAAITEDGDVVQLFGPLRSLDAQREPRSKRTGSSRSFLVVGTPRNRAEFTTVIRAFALAGRWGDRLTLVGYGQHRRRLEKWATALRIDAVVTFAEADAGCSVVGHDVVILISPHPKSIRLVLHALLDGMGVLATSDNLAAVQLLSGGGLGLVFPPRDVSALSHAMLVLSEPDYAAVRRCLEKHEAGEDAHAPAIRLDMEPPATLDEL